MSGSQSHRVRQRRTYGGGRPRGFSPKPEGPRDGVSARLLRSEIDQALPFDTRNRKRRFVDALRSLVAMYKAVEWLHDTARTLPEPPSSTAADPWVQLSLRLYTAEVTMLRDLGDGNITAGMRELIRLGPHMPQRAAPIDPAAVLQAPSLLADSLEDDAPLSAEELAALEAEESEMAEELGAGMTRQDLEIVDRAAEKLFLPGTREKLK